MTKTTQTTAALKPWSTPAVRVAQLHTAETAGTVPTGDFRSPS